MRDYECRRKSEDGRRKNDDGNKKRRLECKKKGKPKLGLSRIESKSRQEMSPDRSSKASTLANTRLNKHSGQYYLAEKIPSELQSANESKSLNDSLMKPKSEKPGTSVNAKSDFKQIKSVNEAL